MEDIKKKVKTAQSCHWRFVCNNPTPEDLECFERLNVRYIVISHEVGDSGTPHYQGYIVFHSNQRLSGLKKLNRRSNWLTCDGCVPANQNYVKKTGSVMVLERGEPPLPKAKAAAVAASARREAYEVTLEHAKAGRFEEIEAGMLIRHYNTLKRIRLDMKHEIAPLPELDNYWIWGPTGTGKSTLARELGGGDENIFIKNCDKWWNEYDGQESVLIEDFSPNPAMAQFLKCWSDHYYFSAEMKYGYTKIRPKRIIVTSNYRIEECFGTRDVPAMLRRFKVILKQ